MFAGKPRDELKLNTAVLLFEGDSQSKKELEINRRRHAQKQFTLFTGVGCSSHGGGAVSVKKGLLCVLDEGSSRFRDFYWFPSAALEQFHSKLSLHFADLVTEGGLRNVDSFRRPSKMEFLANSHDVPHRAKFYTGIHRRKQPEPSAMLSYRLWLRPSPVSSNSCRKGRSRTHRARLRLTVQDIACRDWCCERRDQVLNN